MLVISALTLFFSFSTNLTNAEDFAYSFFSSHDSSLNSIFLLPNTFLKATKSMFLSAVVSAG
jgi:hypothetical protein